ncbi:MAG TPA: signal peptidase I [Armatimonadota bacterium]
MQSSPLLQLLKLMENPVVVITLILVMIGVRVFWLRLQRSADSTAAIATRKSRAAVDVAPAAPKKKDIVLEVIDTLLIALILVFGLVRPFLLQTFFIPSGSMEPTLLISDKLIANKFVYRFRTPQPGEVVVFQPPLEAIVANNNIPLLERTWLEETPPEVQQQVLGGFSEHPEWALSALPPFPTDLDDFIKRVIAVSGDRVRVVAGEGVYINGKLLDERYLPDHHSASAKDFPFVTPDPGPPPTFAQAAKSIGNLALARQEFSDRFAAWLRDWYDYQHIYRLRIAPYVRDGEFVVPAGAVFVMGDNRSNGGSFDSRYWGVVPLHNVRARAVSTFWPLTRLKLL